MPVSDEGFIDVPGGRVFYQSYGSGGVPVLCLHGGPGFPAFYLEPLQDLSDRRQVIFYDQLGCGRSVAPNDPSLWVVDRFVEELVAVRAALGLERLHLWGSSWGGMLGMEYIIREQPDLVSFVNCSGPASSPLWNSETRRLLHELPAELVEEIERHEANGWYSCPEYQAASLEFSRRHGCRMRPWPDGLERSQAAANIELYTYLFGPSEFAGIGTLKDWDISDQLGAIRVPTLLTSGRHDECTPLQMERIKDRIPGSRWEIFENSSHLQFYEERDAYMELMNDWFDETEGAG